MKKPIVKISVVASSLIAVLIAVLACDIYINYMEYLEIGTNFTNVFFVDFNSKLFTFICSFVFFGLFLVANNFVIKLNLFSIDNYFKNIKVMKKTVYLLFFGIIVALIFAIVSTGTIAETIMPYLNSVFFGSSDPVFDKDIGYYVFQRPFYISLTNVLSFFTGFSIFITIGLYIFFYGKFDFYNMKNIFKEKGVMTHTFFLIMLYFLIKAFSYHYLKENILFENNNFVGADFVDINVWLKFYNVAPIIIIAVVIITTMFILKQKLKFATITVFVYPLFYLMTSIIAGVVNLTVVDPNEMTIQSQFIQNNINYTRAAYGIDNSKEYEYDIKHNLDSNKIADNLGTVNNIRINDFDQTVNILNQLQSLKTYYSFTDTDVVTYTLDGEPTAVSIAAREINTDKLEKSAKTYVNTKMRYTHGMGVVINKMNTVNSLGQPNFVVKDIPVISDYDELKISEPRIYYGETNNDYVIVGTKNGETDDIYAGGYYYQGKSGIGLNLFNRVILAVRETDFNLLISDQISSNSKMLLNTNIINRVKKIAPFLKYDSDPTIVIDDDGSLKWIIDGYTTSEYYPYSQYTDDYNYIRNSVKVVIDAYHGTTKFYIIDNDDPVVKSYSKIYTSLFEKDMFPETLKEHIRYPIDIFNVQATILQKYHIKSASDFYQKKGVWSFANEKTAESVTHSVKPYYNYMIVEGETPELVLMIPYTLANKDNMISWIAVRCTGENYGEMIVYNFSQSENISGPYQVENRIDSDSNLSKDISLWESSGSSVIRGNLLVIPIENNLLYVEPIYITSGEGESMLPQIARIVMVYNDTVVSEPTFESCLEKLFGYRLPEKNDEKNEDNDLEYYVKEAVDSYNNIKIYSQNGDWESFGKSMNKLEKDIENLENYYLNKDSEDTQ